MSKVLCQKIVKAFPNVECNIVYGSTEAEPIAHADMKEFIESSGRGLLRGKIINVLNAKIINISKIPCTEDEVERGSVGEIILSGPHVIKDYIDDHPANKILKLRSSNNVVWHRTGDLGYFDQKGRLWLVGRISDQILSSEGLIPCYDLEEELVALIGSRCAFINSNNSLFIEGDLNEEIESKIKSFLVVKKLEEFSIESIDKLPVDQRHFSRVDREKLGLEK